MDKQTGFNVKTDPVIKQFVNTVSASKKSIECIYLFGSRCRNNWRPDSDYDILIVVNKKNKETISLFYDAVTDILLGTGKLVSLKIFTTTEFTRLKSIPTPFIKNILTEGIKLGLND